MGRGGRESRGQGRGGRVGRRRRALLSEVSKRFPTMLFTMRALEAPQTRFGLVECLGHDMLQPYPVLHEKGDHLVPSPPSPSPGVPPPFPARPARERTPASTWCPRGREVLAVIRCGGQGRVGGGGGC